ncbi:MAG: glycosyltransferase 87 family protein [Thermaerobacterales bacterium]
MTRVLVIAGLIWLGGLAWTAAALAASGGALLPAFVARVLLLHLIYLAAVVAMIRRPRIRPGTGGRCTNLRMTLIVIFAVALLGRLWLWGAGDPLLSGDVYRYLWDGRLILNGINPYGPAPDDPLLTGMRDWIFWERMGFRDHPTIYPPGAQGLFALMARLGSDSVLPARLVLTALEMGAALWLVRLLPALGQAPERIIIWLWNPLAAIEIAYSAHLEGAVAALTVAAIAAAAARRPRAAGLGLGLAGLLKLYPLVLAPALWRSPDRRLPLALAATLTVGVAPLFFTGHPGSALMRFGTETGFNAPVALYAAELAALLLQDAEAARLAVNGVLMGALALIGAWTAWGRGAAFDLPGRLLVMGMAAVVLAPVLHPWYLVWLLPVMVIRPAPPLLVLSGTVMISYLFYLPPDRVIAGLWLAEWLPVVAAAFGWWGWRRRKKGNEKIKQYH